MRSAAEVVDLCRLPRLPHEVLGFTGLTNAQALFFDLSYVRAGKHVRMVDALDAMHRVGSGDLGIAKMLSLLAQQYERS